MLNLISGTVWLSSCFQCIVTLKSTIQDVKVRGQISYFLFIVCYFVTSFFIFYCYLEEHNTRSQSQKTDHAHNQGNIILAGKFMVIMMSKMWMWCYQIWWQLLMVLIDRKVYMFLPFPNLVHMYLCQKIELKRIHMLVGSRKLRWIGCQVYFQTVHFYWEKKLNVAAGIGKEYNYINNQLQCSCDV